MEILFYYSQSDEILEASPCSPFYYPASILLILYRDNSLRNFENVDVSNIFTILSFIVGKTRHNDYLAGTLGLISLLDDIEDVIPVELKTQFEELRLKCIGKISMDVKEIEDKVYWETYDNNKVKDYGGFAHGTASAAFVISKSSKTNQYLFPVKNILNHDRSFFSNEISGWTDTREGLKKKMDTVSWCHGSAGIGLGRLLTSQYYMDKKIGDELEIAKKNIIVKGLGNNQSICHGDLGNLEILYAISRKSNDVELQLKILSYLEN